MKLLSLLVSATAALAINYEGQLYSMTISSPNSTSPWYTGGSNSIEAVTIQTLICCPPLPPVAWVLKNNDTSLLAETLTLSGSDNFDPPTNPDISGARAGKGYVLSAVLGTDRSQSFGDSEPFEIKEGALSPPIAGPSFSGNSTASMSSMPSSSSSINTHQATATNAASKSGTMVSGGGTTVLPEPSEPGTGGSESRTESGQETSPNTPMTSKDVSPSGMTTSAASSSTSSGPSASTTSNGAEKTTLRLGWLVVVAVAALA